MKDQTRRTEITIETHEIIRFGRKQNVSESGHDWQPEVEAYLERQADSGGAEEACPAEANDDENK